MLQPRRRHRMRIAGPAAVLAGGTLLFGAPQTEPRTSGAPWTVSRTPDGQPDLQGVWTNYDATPFERLDAAEERQRGPSVSTADWLVQDSPTSPRRASMVVEPPKCVP